MNFRNQGYVVRSGSHRVRIGMTLVICIAVGLIFLGNVSFAAEPLQKYQVVNGSDDKAYLVNTTTGFVWVLTYRTTATGREPIALPYKFIKVSPKNENNFLVEAADSTILPVKGTK